MTGAIVVDVGAAQLDGARAALARAVASGALGGGARTVRRDGEGCAFEDGRIDVTSDGRVTWSLATARSDRWRAVEATLVATTVAVAATLGWAAAIYVALPVGAAAGVAFAWLRIADDRAALKRRMRALVASLPVLLDTRGQ
jgi:hypothetical protein